jgi:hypothetical protein
MRFLVLSRLLERLELRFGEDEALLRHLRLEHLQALLHRREVVPLPDAAHARRRDR